MKYFHGQLLSFLIHEARIFKCKQKKNMGRKRKIPLSYRVRPWYRGDITSDSDEDDNNGPGPRTRPRMSHMLMSPEPFLSDPPSDPPSDPASLISSSFYGGLDSDIQSSPLSTVNEGDRRSVHGDEDLSVLPATLESHTDEDLSRDSASVLGISGSNIDDDLSGDHASLDGSSQRDPDSNIDDDLSGDHASLDGSSQRDPDSHIDDDLSGDSASVLGLSGDPHSPTVFEDVNSPSQFADDPPLEMDIASQVQSEDEVDPEVHSLHTSDSLIPEEEDQEETNYYILLDRLSRDWLNIELNHTVSKTASDLFWRLATSRMSELFSAKKAQNIRRKTPQMQQIRKKLEKQAPEIDMEIGYINHDTGEMEVKNNLRSTPVKLFPPSEYTKAYEIASVNVSISICIFIGIVVFNFTK